MNKTSMFAVIQQDLKQVETELKSVIQSPVDRVNHIYSHLLQAGGKRLRPALYMLCAKSRNISHEPQWPLALAIELIHMATLVHDDVIDNAATRRSHPTANVVWGNHVSVLAGDYLFAKAFSIVAANADNRCLRKLTEVVCSICEGEILQSKAVFDPEQTEEAYLSRLAQKTADLIAVSCELGGISAGHSEEVCEALRRYGHAIGMAFQLTDDILDVTASAEQVGKPVGHDLRQGIITLPVIYALTHSPRREELKALILSRDMSEEKVRRGLSLVHETDAVEYAYSRVRDYLTTAVNVLPDAINSEVRGTLAQVANFIGLRTY